MLIISQEFEMASPLRVGHVHEISFPPVTPRIIIHSERELSVEIVKPNGNH